MIKRLLKCALLGTIIGIVLSLGLVKYQDDQDIIRQQIAQVQRQQAMLVMGAKNPLPALVKKVASSVVYVESLYWSGSGVIVGPHTILTARHIVRDATYLEIETVDGEIYEAIDWVEDEDNDCALIFFDPRKEFKNIAEFADSDKLQIGQVVFTMGSPYGRELFNTVTLGIISGLGREIPYFGTCGLITSDAASNPGNSGGPSFNIQGQIVGIVVGLKRGADGLAVTVPSNICRALLEKEI